MARFSIVIPTYNRAWCISRAIESALSQTHPDVEVIVSDNASTDNTEEVVQGFGDKVRYHRNETNIGLWGNFGLSPDLATGEFFSWLTDDDLLRKDFASRAIRSLAMGEDVQMYISWCAYTQSPVSIPKGTTIHGPMIPVDWLSTEPTLIDGLLIAPLNCFVSQAMPPGVAFRTEAARRSVKDLIPDNLQFNEYIFAASVAATGRVAIDPWIGALHLSHDTQAHIVTGRDPVEMLNQKRSHAEFCQRFMPGLPGRWRDLFRNCLKELPIDSRYGLIRDAVHNNENRVAFWAEAPPVVCELRDMVLETLSGWWRDDLRWAFDSKSQFETKSKSLIRKYIPRRVWNTLRGAHDGWKSDGV